MTATITSSASTSVAQIDGRLSVDELFIDSLGVSRRMSKWVGALTDLQAMLTADSNTLLANLQSSEVQTNVDQVTSNGSLAVLTFNYSTQGQGLSALRAAYQTATQLQAVMIGDFLSTLTDTQLGNIFNMTLAQVTTLRANKLTPASQTAATIRAAAGQ